MALQTSGAISLNDIHIEAGGSSGTTASLNDSDIRDLIGKGSGATSSFSEFYGASAVQPFASYSTSFGSVTSNSSGKITIYTCSYTNPTLPLRGTTGATFTFNPATTDSSGVATTSLPFVQSTLALSSNPFYQLYTQLNPTLISGPTTGTDIVGNPTTYTYWALDPVDFGYQSVTFQGLTVTFHKATTSDVPPPGTGGQILSVNGLAIQRYQTSSYGANTDRWGINLAGTVSGTPISGATFVQGVGFASGSASITGKTLTFNGYS